VTLSWSRFNACGARGFPLDALEQALAGRDHLCGRFGAADIATFLVVGFASTLSVAPGPTHPAVAAWFERVRTRPTVGAEFDAMMRAAAAV
jgi:glutathione S-transferase